MPYLLGISAFYHDSAAVLVRDGEIVAAAQEERFSRKKHDPRFPQRAINYCLGEAFIDPSDLDAVVFYDNPLLTFDRVTKNAVVIAPGRLDRSATGTGLSARMAVLHARGLMKVGDAMTHASPIGSTFDGRIVAETENGIVPAIRGSAFITGTTELYVDSSDPYPEGYLLSDTWPGGDVQ